MSSFPNGLTPDSSVTPSTSPFVVDAGRSGRPPATVTPRTTIPPTAMRRPPSTASLILIANDDPTLRRALRPLLESAGYKVLEANGGREAVAHVSENVAVVLLDPSTPDLPGLDCIRYIRTHYPDTQVIAISDGGNPRDAVAALKEGVFEYLTKPCNREELMIHLHQAVQAGKLSRDNRELRQAVSSPVAAAELAGSSPEMRTVRAQIERYAQLTSNVLIAGGIGTGKTSAAQLIHRNSPRRAEPFVSVNCGALPRDLIEAELFGHVQGAFAGVTGDRPGRAEIADGGTLFLDEIGDLPLELQPKLLDFLQDHTIRRIGSNVTRHVDVRVIAATNRTLIAMCRQGRFREDLYNRIDVLSLGMPLLREHRTDIPELAFEMLHRIARRRDWPPFVLTDDALHALQQHDWPGNARELENSLERASASCTDATIRRKDIVLDRLYTNTRNHNDPEQLGLAGMTLAAIERRAVIETLRSCGGNKVKTARQLGVSEKTIYNKIKQYKLAGTI